MSNNRARALSLAGTSTTSVLPVGDQSLRQRPACAVAALDRPNPLRPRRDVLSHRGIAGLVGAEPSLGQHRLPLVDDLDRRGQLVGINPNEHLRHAATSFLVSSWTCRDCEAGIAVASRAVPSGATPRHGTRRERKPKESHTDQAGGQPREEQPRQAPEPSLAGHRSYRQASNSRETVTYGRTRYRVCRWACVATAQTPIT